MLKAIKKNKNYYETEITNVNIKCTSNNIIIAITNFKGNVLFWASSGTAGFKGARKHTPYAAQCVTKIIISRLKELNLKNIKIIIKGVGLCRETPIKIFKNFGLKILSIIDKSSIAFNGCRLPKRRKL